MNKLFKSFLILLALLLLVVPVIFGFIIYNSSTGAIKNSFSGDNSRQSVLRESKVDAAKEPISILFLGIDDSKSRREAGQSSDHARTDSMILSTLNPKKSQIRMLNIPRDTVSYIPQIGEYDKITHAHAYAGPEASMDSVEATLNVPVDYYVRINMKAFVDTVDELGGIYYDVPYDLNEPNKLDKGRIKLKKGHQKLDGEEALAVARTRRHDSDLKRGQRQMDILKKLFEKAQSTNSINKLNEVIQIVGDNAKHNLSSAEIQGIASKYLTSGMDIKTEQLKGKDETLNDVYYYKPTMESLEKYSNKLRKDLEMKKIKDQDEFLNKRVMDHYGNIVAKTPIDDELLNEKQKKKKPEDKSNKDVKTQDAKSSEEPTYQSPEDTSSTHEVPQSSTSDQPSGEYNQVPDDSNNQSSSVSS
ncbi:LCP family protein [Staphylococcus massiliensis]|uniref:LCP family protein n=1 Tax=Staphylococcus massiliensis TaxID=555791 RepID=UPI001EDF07D6|nr:LCP family protein [Staphylococcus massiliensis]MCG3413382.1 LCP family protein [Staphylococcus massiliensis]